MAGYAIIHDEIQDQTLFAEFRRRVGADRRGSRGEDTWCAVERLRSWTATGRLTASL